MFKKKEAADIAEKKEKKERVKREREKKRKARKKRVQKEPKARSEEYIMRKNIIMRVARWTLWIMLIFVFIRGVLTCLEEDSGDEAKRIIREFEAEFTEYKDDNEEIMGFTQNFVREYLSYESGKESDYAERIKPYVSVTLQKRATELVDFKGKAAAVYAKAYRKEIYAENQYDVYVLADVEYEIAEIVEKNRETIKNTIIKQETVTLKVPIYSEKGKYVVEGIPVIVNDSMGLTNYSVEEYSEMPISDGRQILVQEAIKSFLTAYYEQEQNVIEYYLTKSADRSKFKGLSGRYRFDKIETINCYEENGNILCIVDFMVIDAANESRLMQSLNLSVKADGDKYYIQDMNTKTGHL